MTENTPAVTATPGTPAPLDPEFIEALKVQAHLTLWPIFDEEATKAAREKDIEKRLANGESRLSAEMNSDRIKLEKWRKRDLLAVDTFFDNITPQDAIEGMLSGQMTIVHNAVMELMQINRIARENHSNRSDNVQSAAKLIRAFVSLSDALDRHRGKGNTHQTINVIHQHIHVDDGAQAVIGGNVTSGRGAGKNAEKPHAQD